MSLTLYPEDIIDGTVTLADLAPLAAFSVIGNETASSATPTAVKMNAVPGYATTATAAGSTTLTNVSKGVQRFTGATTQTVVLPVVTTLPQTGFGYWIVNDSTGAVTVNSSGGNAVQVVAANSRVWVFAILLTGTSAASWDVLYVPAAIAANITNTPAGSIAATTVQAAIDELDTDKVAKLWTVVESSAANVAPTAADSGKYYRLSNAAAQVRLPTTSLVVGETEFWLTFSDPAGLGVVIVNPQGNSLDHIINDVGTFTPQVTTSSVTAYPNRLFHIRYVAANTWASDLIGPA